MLLLDCRTPEEHATAKIAGAVLLPMQELSERVGELEAWQTKPIIVHCHHGGRSLRVTHWLRERGFPNVSSMQGGIDAWSTDVDRTVPRY
jgi:adenylyltransferase/sulfurtransferase